MRSARPLFLTVTHVRSLFNSNTLFTFLQCRLTFKITNHMKTKSEYWLHEKIVWAQINYVLLITNCDRDEYVGTQNSTLACMSVYTFHLCFAKRVIFKTNLNAISNTCNWVRQCYRIPLEMSSLTSPADMRYTHTSNGGFSFNSDNTNRFRLVESFQYKNSVENIFNSFRNMG